VCLGLCGSLVSWGVKPGREGRGGYGRKQIGQDVLE